MMPSSDKERERWNRKYREASGTRPIGATAPDPFLPLAFSEFVLPLFPNGGTALDLAGGTGRHAIWLAKQGWGVTLIDISETGVEQAQQNAGPLSSRIRFVVDDLTHLEAWQTRCQVGIEVGFEVVMTFFYLERKIFPQIVRAIRPGGLLIYKTPTSAQAKLDGGSRGPKNPAYLLEPGELLQLANGLRVLHYREQAGNLATAELVAIA
jgi:SAM-dependent methyltransferase